jgi:hypothetical protein
MRKFLAIGYVALGVALIGCSPKPSLLGKWQVEEEPGQVTTITISKDQLILEFTESSEDVEIVSSYEATDNTLRYTFEEIIVGSKKSEMTSGKTKEMTYVFKDDDTLEGTIKTVSWSPGNV